MRDEVGPILNEDDLRREAIKRVVEGMTPVEPRILLDAVMDLSGGLDDSADLLFAVAGALTEQNEEFNRVFDGVEDAFTQHLAGSETAYDIGGPEGATDKMFSNLRASLDASLAAFEARLDGFVVGEADTLRNSLNTALQSEFGAGVGQLEAGVGIPGILVIEESGTEKLLTVENLSDRDAFTDAAADLVGGSLGDADRERLGDFITDAFVDYAIDDGFDLFTINLNNGSIGTGAHTFTDAGEGRVSLSASGDSLAFNPNGFVQSFSGSEDFSIQVPGTQFDFDGIIEVEADANSYRLIADGFDIEDFTIGGRVFDEGTAGGIFSPGDGAPQGVVNFEGLGSTLVSLDVMDIAELRFGETGLSDVVITSEYSFDFDSAAARTTEASIAFTSEISEASIDSEPAFAATSPASSERLFEGFVNILTQVGGQETARDIVLQPQAPVAFSTVVETGGTGFGGAGSGDVNRDINDPSLVLGGLDFILEAADRAIDLALAAAELPLIGDGLGLAFTVFDDIRFDLINRAESQTTNPDGSPVTTIDLLTGFFNDELNELLGTTSQTYLQADIKGFNNVQDNFLYGNLGFSTEIFSAEISSRFEFGVDLPGLDFEFENGSPLTLTAFADLNIGFGVDNQGFFLLNDTNEAEISLDFVVDAGDFEGQFNVGGLLDFTAVAVKDPTQLDLFTFAEAPPEGEKGDLKLSASLEADLYGDAGVAETRRMDGFTVTKGDGTIVRAETAVRIAELNQRESFGDPIVDIDLTADADINLQLTGEVLDPTTGRPVEVNGVSVIPKVITELVVDASYTIDEGTTQIDQLLLNDLRLDANDIFDGFIKPVTDPLQPFVGPITGLYNFINTPPVSFALPAATAAVPAIGLANDILTIATRAANIVDGLNETDGFVLYGDHFIDNGGRATNGASLNASNLDENQKGQTLNQYLQEKNLAVGPTNSLEIDLPIITNASTALALLQGNFDEVELVTATFTGIDIELSTEDLLSEIRNVISSTGVPSEVTDFILDRAFPVSVDVEAFFGFTAGYDLSGIEGFVETLNPERLFDGIFIDVDDANGNPVEVEVRDPITGILIGTFTETEGGILDLSLDVDGELSFGGTFLGTGLEIGLRANASTDFNLTLDDPNRDGKLRFYEIIELLEDVGLQDFSISSLGGISAGTFKTYLNQFFDGSFDIDLGFEFFGEVGVLGIGDSFSVDVFNFDDSISLTGGGIGEGRPTTQLEGNTVALNVGTRKADSFFTTNISEGATATELISLRGDSSEIFSSYLAQDFITGTPLLGDTFSADAVIVSAGDGINGVSYASLSGVDTLTFAGDGAGFEFTTQVTLPNDGFHVVFGGDTGNKITTEAGARGTYWIFGGEGSDQTIITDTDDRTINFGDDYYGVRDAFQAAFANGNFSQSAAETVLINHFKSLGLTDTELTGADGVTAVLQDLAATHTVNTQLTASKAADSFNLGSGIDGEGGTGLGDHYVFAGGGSDNIVIRGGDQATVLGGAGDDNISIRAGEQSFAEGGAGADTLSGGVGADTLFGYSAALGNDGKTDDNGINALAYQDGDDVLLGADGNDSLFGQRGDNFIEGSAGNDTIGGGLGDDLLFGGKLEAELSDGSVFDLGNVSFDALVGKTLEARAFDDGNDRLFGFGGDDILFGGSGADTLEATSGKNVLIGDNAEVEFIGAGQIGSIVSSQVGEDSNGRDSITGGIGADILVGGGGGDETLFQGGDVLVDRSGGTIFIGDDASITGGDLFNGADLITSITGAGAFAGDIITSSNGVSGGGFDTILGGEGEEVVRAGGGGNILVSELGIIDLVNGTVTSTDTELFGDGPRSDTESLVIATNNSSGVLNKVGAANLVIAGGGSDSFSGGAFADFVLLDSGEIVFDATAWDDLKFTSVPFDQSNPTTDEQTAIDEVQALNDSLITSMESLGLDTDGDDVFQVLGGGGIVIAGGGSDGRTSDLNFTGGDGVLLLDSGRVDFANNVIESVASEFAGDDKALIGSGNHIVIGGGGADELTLGNLNFDLNFLSGTGDHVIIGDDGKVNLHPTIGSVLSLTSLASASDGNDKVAAFLGDGETRPSTGNGSNRVILGGGSDSLLLGDGRNFVVGDGGRIDFVGGAVSSVVDPDNADEDSDAFAGGDTIKLGTGNNRVVGGGGADAILLDDLEVDSVLADGATSGGHFVISDGGQITLNSLREVQSLTSIGEDADGDDTVRAGHGQNRLILGGGDDSFTGGDGRTFLVADSGRHNLVFPKVESFDTRTTGADTVTLGDGSNVVIGGGKADSLTFGDGFNRVLGDSGEFDFTTGIYAANEQVNARGGADTITAGTGEAIILAGTSGDIITLGVQDDTDQLSDADSIILGDYGTVTLENSELTNGVAAAAREVRGGQAAFDGGDTIRVGNGDHLIIGGAAGDDIKAGNNLFSTGSNIIIGDVGVIDLTQTGETDENGDRGSVRGQGSNGNADDTIFAGAGDDIIIGGSQGDLIRNFSGDDIVLGDLGTIGFDISTRENVTITAVTDNRDGNDTIDGGTGEMLLVGGGGADQISSVDGSTIVLGDGGSINLITGLASSTLTGDDPTAFDGADQITVGEGVDIVIGGGGADTVTKTRDQNTGDGENDQRLFVVGDTGAAAFNATNNDFIRIVTSMSATALASDGGDIVNALEASTVHAILGGGADEIIVADGDAIIIGDGGRLDFNGDVVEGFVSAFDGADTITGGDGDNIVIGGGGADQITLGDGVNFVLGDGGQVDLDGSNDPFRLFATNNALDGADVILLGDADNRVVLGGGDDSLTAGDGANAVIGDGGRISVGSSQISLTTSGRDIETSLSDGADVITLGAGDNLVIGGAGSDVIATGVPAEGEAAATTFGDNIIVSSLGALTAEIGTLALVSASAAATSRTDNDRVTTQSGADTLIGGSGRDTLNAGEGAAVVIGDAGSVDTLEAVGAVDASSGADVITTGGQADTVIGGGSGDTLNIGEGANLVLGDSGSVLLDGSILTSASDTRDGGDTLTAGNGANVAILGGGADRATIGVGDSFLIADSGEINLTTGTISSTANARDGNDTITAGDGASQFIGGAGDDSFTLGAGGNFLLGDSGVITFDAATRAALTLTSDHNALDGADTVTANDGDNFAILGGGADSLSVGKGDNFVATDGGSINLTTGVMTSEANALGGDDSVTAGDGAGRFIGGSGADNFTLGAGGNFLLGDSGTVTFDTATLAPITLTSDHNTLDGADVVTAQNGNNFAILGGGADSLNVGTGDNFVVADGGAINFTTGVMSNTADTLGGNDSITAGDGAGRFIGGSGDDLFTLGTGGNFLLGDSGEVTFNTTTFAPITLTSDHNALDGADVVTAQNGDNFAILGGGADSLNVGTGDNFVVADGGAINFTTGVMSNTADTLGGNDTITAGNGAGRFIGGSGADMFTLGEGGNFLLGDSGTVTFDTTTFAPLTLTSDHNALDGADVVTALNGNNFAILGGGADSLNVGTGDNFVIADGGSVNLTTGVLTNVASDLGGNDTIVAGDGAGQFIGGSGDDLFTLGTGGNFLLGDSGEITFDAETGAALTLTSVHNALDGADVVTAQNGDNFAILGGAADRMTVGVGDNSVIADGGTINLVTGLMENDANDLGGNDTVTAGDGVGRFVGGSGADLFTLGAGGNFLLGDSGRITFNPTTLAPLTLTSAHDERDGDDTVTAGNGGNFGILGGGADSLTVGTGNNFVITDGGEIDLVAGTMQNEANLLGGDDTVTAGDGAGRFIGGSGSDTFTLGEGGNFLLGDSGLITFDPTTLAPLTLTSQHNALDGDDVITALDGSNFGILGGGADSLTVGNGDNFIITDGGAIDLVNGSLANEADALGGDDTVVAGNGAGQFIGGSGADLFTLGTGANFLLGDSGLITFDPATRAALTLTSDHDVLDGSDTVTAGDGDSRAILGGGADLAAFGDGDNLIIGDGGEIDLVLGRAENATNALSGEDTIRAGDGDGLIIGGSFDDLIEVGDGSKLILGDTGVLTFVPATLAPLTGVSVHDERDGDDTVTAADGGGLAILGGGDDLATFGDGDNTVIMDGGSIDLVTGRAETATNELAGEDELVIGDGDNLILGGSFDDLLTTGDGNNLILADTGVITFTQATRTALTLNSVHDARDGEDVLFAGNGSNRIILGGADDTATFGDGDNALIADGGSIDLVTGDAVNATNALSGLDTVTGGNGDNLVIGGSFVDEITLGDGDNTILGDTGEIDFDGATLALNNATSRFDARDGEDTVVAGDGDNTAILGGASDDGLFGDGGNQIIADSGQVVSATATSAGLMSSTDDDTGAVDLITVGAGNDTVIGGDAGDRIIAADGDNVIIGDNGDLTFDQSGKRLLSFFSSDPAIGGDDVVDTGAGNDIVVGGFGDDTIRTAAGDDIAAGDWISIISPLGGGGVGEVLSTDVTVEGQDLIQTGADADIAIGGGEADTIEVGEGFDVALGDNGRIEYVNVTDVDVLELTELARGANDTLSATGLGDNILIGQFGEDRLSGGDRNDILIGDLAEVFFLPTGVFDLNESQVERLEFAEYIRPDLGFDDFLEGGAGRDSLLAGFGDDTLRGGDGQDLLAGDTFLIQTVFETDAAGNPVVERLTFESNFAFLEGGVDDLDGEDGPDIVIGHIGPDFLNGDTENDFLSGDSAALLLTADFSSADFDPDRTFDLITVNFAGPSAGDLVANAQVSGSIGFQLGNFAEANDRETGVEAIQAIADSRVEGEELIELLAQRSQTLFAAVASVSNSAEAVESLSDLMSLDLPPDLRLEMMTDGLVEEITAALEGNLSALDRYLILRILQEVVIPALEDAAAAEEPLEEDEETAEDVAQEAA